MTMTSSQPFFIRLLAVLSMLLGLALGTTMADAQSSVRPPDNAVNQGLTAPLGSQSDADIWRQLKQGGIGTPSASGDIPLPMAPGRPDNVAETFWKEITAPARDASATSGTPRVMQVLGEEWRLLRRDYILPYAGWVLVAVLALIALFGIVRGRIKIRDGRSGKYIFRFSMAHRIAHWFLAASFILMAISGLVILLGRPVLVPLIGKDANAVLTSAMLQGHNLFGPVFILSLLIVIFKFMKGNFFQWADAKWIAKGGGLLWGHASSHHYNFGEKTWYWVVVIVGLIMSATGMLLLFPWITDVLAWHQLSTVLHAGGAILMIAFALGHAYVGSIGMEGSLDSMLRGEVDENWAKEHHDLWYEEVTGKKVTHEDEPEAAETAEGSA
ncbi:formate dehydrogenase subunit gamma [Alisedimentitalea sp. MJ-SS2]|uniref:formate dehydrogenase subunit gamma n=1 Tax=Aliisedimentitalea sp. MJ-SS2 TaxID=3049795 RepID=UPI00290B285D|nr:formate dehydrogenase subunit gamma [Alisedimentitalea sp. MJ-SS2]MDU8929362.1 formate dehydrogenase subunit gamma [Alisedimentitalea sp. MJ-SS2]